MADWSEGVHKMTNLEELRTLYAAATQGKWLRGETLCSITNEKGTMIFTSTEADAKLIVAMHNALPALLEDNYEHNHFTCP